MDVRYHRRIRCRDWQSAVRPAKRKSSISKPILKKTLHLLHRCPSDLYVYFYERGLQLLSPNGIHTFICSNSWLDVNYGAPLQKYLLDNTAGAIICHSEAEREFESADINTIVSLLHNGTPRCRVSSPFSDLQNLHRRSRYRKPSRADAPLYRVNTSRHA